jgi:translation initiation factor 1
LRQGKKPAINWKKLQRRDRTRDGAKVSAPGKNDDSTGYHTMTNFKTRVNRTVYSTEHGRLCPDCSNPVADCVCRTHKDSQTGDGVVRVGRQTKGRKGKGVTTISGVPLDSASLKLLGKELKRRCGSGGTVKDTIIEIQGDHRELLFEELQKRGWQVKRSGG